MSAYFPIIIGLENGIRASQIACVVRQLLMFYSHPVDPAPFLPFIPLKMDNTQVMKLATCSIQMQFAAADLVRAIELIRSAMEPIRVKPGCRDCQISKDVEEAGTLRYNEEWTSAEAFRQHVQSEDFWPILIAMDLCSTEPQVRIGDLVMRGGLRFLLGLRESLARDSKAMMETSSLDL